MSERERERTLLDDGREVDAADAADATEDADESEFEWVVGGDAGDDADADDASDASDESDAAGNAGDDADDADAGGVVQLGGAGVPAGLSPIPPVGLGGADSVAGDAPAAGQSGSAGPIGTWEARSDADGGVGVDATWRRRLRRARLGLGVAALLAGAVLVVVPETLAAFDDLATTGVETAAGVVGGLAVLQALVAAVRLRYASDDADDGPTFDPAADRPSVSTSSPPGGGHQGLVDGYDRLDADSRARLRRRVRTVVARSLAADGADRATIERAVAEGTWTDDVRAAAYLGDVAVPWRTRVREWLSAGSAEGGRAERAIEAAWRRRTGAPPGGDDPLAWTDAGVATGPDGPGDAGPAGRATATDGGRDAGFDPDAGAAGEVGR